LILYLGLLATLLGYIGWNIGLRGLGPTRAVSFTYAISPLAVLIGAIALDEPLTGWLVVGAALVVAGIALTQRKPTRSEAFAEEPEAVLARWRAEQSAPSRSAS
jgi:drug/metabolite transporter (DMT)-like permease